MTKQVQRRRGTATQHTSFTGAEGEISVNTTNKSVHVHDGTTAGGIEAARADMTNVTDANLNARLNGNTLSSLTITSADINGGTIDGTVIGGTTPAAVTGTTITGTSFVTTGDMTFGDNDKAIFGAGSDLQIYHDGSNSYVSDVGTGRLFLSSDGDGVNIITSTGENLIRTDNDGQVRVYFDDAEKFRTNSTGVDVTGTITSDGLTVDGNATITGNTGAGNFGVTLRNDDGAGHGVKIRGGNNTASVDSLVVTKESNDSYVLKANSTGDIHFYEDTGTTPKLTWDASAEALGIGTSSPETSYKLDVAGWGTFTHPSGDCVLKLETGNNTGGDFIYFGDTDDGDVGVIGYIHSTDHMYFRTNAAERMRIDSSGRVGIGEVSPATDLHITNSGATQLLLESGNTSQGILLFGDAEDLNVGSLTYDHSDNSMRFETSDTERMRIDSSGNVLVGKTSVNATDVGIVANASGRLFTAVNGDSNVFNRTTSDGAIVEFRKDNTTIGQIGVQGSIFIGANDTNLRFISGSPDRIVPNSGTGDRDNAINLGHTTARFDDIYATNGTIQTSDRNEKQDIAGLDEAERRVAVAAKGLIRKYRWKDAVAEKGDDARIHVGVIAQDLQAAFAAEGLDAGRYAMFISSTWWEAEEIIPAVEEVLDDDGNVVTEAQPERMVTNTYETAEEAPEGATERTRMGVRYPELLAFIIGAM